MDFLLYVIMLVLYTYVCLIPFERNLDFSEWLLLYWFTAMVVVEVKQMVHFTPREYFKSFWNFNDLLIIALYFWSFFFRIISTEKSRYEFDSKTILGMNAIPVYLRLVRFYAISKNLGPKIGLSDSYQENPQGQVRIDRHLNSGKYNLKYNFDFKPHICLYSHDHPHVCCYVLVRSFPSRHSSWLRSCFTHHYAPCAGISAKSDSRSHLWVRYYLYCKIHFILPHYHHYRPYFSIFGRITLDDLNAVSACVGPDPFSSCGYSREWLIPFLQGGYLLIVNILLVNLLIA